MHFQCDFIFPSKSLSNFSSCFNCKLSLLLLPLILGAIFSSVHILHNIVLSYSLLELSFSYMHCFTYSHPISHNVIKHPCSYLLIAKHYTLLRDCPIFFPLPFQAVSTSFFFRSTSVHAVWEMHTCLLCTHFIFISISIFFFYFSSISF